MFRASTSPLRLVYLFVFLSIVRLSFGQSYTSIVVFGDSLSDTGNVARLTQNQFLTRIPGPIADYTDGRFTDGTDTLPSAKTYNGVWIEQLAALFAAKPTIKNSLDGGTNYAYGYGTTANGTSTLSFAPSAPISIQVNNLGQQITDYLATSPALSSGTLYVVWGGANDLINATSAADIAAAAARDVGLVQRLITAGATDILIPNLPPLGLVPRFNGSAAVSAQVNQSVLGFNQALAAGLGTLAAANPGKTLRLYTLDTFSLFNSIVGPPLTGGIVNATASSQGNVAANPDTYLFWDDLHPTTTGHHLIALAAARLLATTPVTTSTTVSSSNLNANLGSSITFTASVVAGVGTTSPTGTVTFRDGTTVLGSSAVNGTTVGSATYTTTGLGAGTHTITAAFTGVNGFSSSTSAAITETITAPAVQSSLSPSSVNVLSGGTAGTTVSVSAVGGFSGTVSFACGTLPAHFSCTFTPASGTLNATTPTGSVSLNIGTARSATSSLLSPFKRGDETMLAFLVLPFGGLLGFAGTRRRGRRSLPLLVLLGLLSAGAAAGLSGCAAENITAAPGTYTIPVNVTAAGATTILNLKVIVQ